MKFDLKFWKHCLVQGFFVAAGAAVGWKLVGLALTWFGGLLALLGGGK